MKRIAQIPYVDPCLPNLYARVIDAALELRQARRILADSSEAERQEARRRALDPDRMRAIEAEKKERIREAEQHRKTLQQAVERVKLRRATVVPKSE